MNIKTMRVLPWSDDQGDFVVINESDFDPKLHTPYDTDDSDAGEGGEDDASGSTERSNAATAAKAPAKVAKPAARGAVRRR